MNRENITRVRDHIASLPPEKFNMEEWGKAHTCGTAACIGGWAAAILLGEDGVYSSERELADAFGMGYDECWSLFYPPIGTSVGFTATIPQAVRVLDHLLATGEVDWSVALKEDVQ